MNGVIILSKKSESSSLIGRIVDMPFEKFKEELKKQHINVGVMQNLILHLEAVYNDLRERKDIIISRSEKGYITSKDEVVKAVKSIYAEMFKVEEKITYLKKHRKELLESLN